MVVFGAASLADGVCARAIRTRTRTRTFTARAPYVQERTHTSTGAPQNGAPQE